MGSQLCKNHDSVILDTPQLQKQTNSQKFKPADSSRPQTILYSQNREQVSSLPITNNHVQERIKKLSKIQTSNNKIWRIKQPINIIYRNLDPKLQDDLPIGYTQIYKIKDNEDFQGFFEGTIQKDLTINLQNSIFVFSNSSYFIGTGTNQGTYTNQVTNLKYEGGWQNQRPQGYGTQNNNKGVYKGHYHLGEKQGLGKFTWGDGMSFQGNFLKGVFHGKGHLQDPLLKYSYQGDYLFGQKHGQGIQKRAKQKYEGQFYKGKRFGKGKLTVYQNQTSQKVLYIYEGTFNDGVPQGRGIYQKPEHKAKIQGIWHMGELKAIL